MKALPLRFTEQTHKFEDVSYTIVPVANNVSSYITGRNLESVTDPDGNVRMENNPGGYAYDIVGFSLKSIDGLEGMTLEFDEVKIGDHVEKRVKDACIARLPRALYMNIWFACAGATVITEEEIENVNFTQDSCSATSNAQEMSEHVYVEVDS